MTFTTPALSATGIHYTLAGHQPELTPVEDDIYSDGYPLRSEIPIPGEQMLVTWRQVLALDHAPLDPALCAPPFRVFPRIQDAAAERQQWRRILSRSTNPEKIAGLPDAVVHMLALLDRYQQSEVTLLSYGLSQGGA